MLGIFNILFINTGVYSYSTINADTDSISTTEKNQTMSIVGGTDITTVATSSNSTITINHDTTTYIAPLVETNKFITSLTVNNGHISAASTSSIDFTVTENTSQF